MINDTGLQADRIVEAFIGEYACGKSENAVNRALELRAEGRRVTIVDLDIVEPFYTLRPIREKLSAAGIKVIAWDNSSVVGLGETGNILRPDMKWALANEGDIILDIGYGINGARTLNLVEGADNCPELKVILVLNVARPMTATVEDIMQHAAEMGRIDGVLNNSHLGNETDAAIIQEGAVIVTEAAAKLNVPVIATSVTAELAEEIGSRDCCGNKVRVLQRLMKDAFW